MVLTIGQVAKTSGIVAKTICFYENQHTVVAWRRRRARRRVPVQRGPGRIAADVATVSACHLWRELPNGHGDPHCVTDIFATRWNHNLTALANL